MAKTERIFPLSTIGGRIQHQRRLEGVSRAELYDAVYIEGNALTKEAKEKTVLNWESGTTQPSYENLIRICKTLDCSSDYILGLEECTKRDYQFVLDMIGISENSIKVLEYEKNNKWLIEYQEFQFVMDSLIRNSSSFDSETPLFSDIQKCIDRQFEKNYALEKVLNNENNENASSLNLNYELKNDIYEAQLFHTVKDFSEVLKKIVNEASDYISTYKKTSDLNRPEAEKHYIGTQPIEK